MMSIRFKSLVLRISVLVCVLTTPSLVTLGQKAPEKSQPQNEFLGGISNGVYKNPFFGFELEVPENWTKFDSGEVDTAKNLGVEALRSESDRTNKLLEEATRAEVVVLALGKFPLGSIENSALAIGVGKQPSSKITAKMVAEAGKSILIKNPRNRLLSDVKTETISGKDFATFEIELGMYGQKIPLRYYAAMIDDYSLTISMSYSDNESLQKMVKALQSIRFSRGSNRMREVAQFINAH